ncbi:MAG: TonB-dependent receptor [Flavobacteriales bacterium]|nr:TonB-dependent receptor [Flavobacteriales bacterium]MCX7767941.1 TonB-dependent receptor [Flavobacteriales bacterium]
MVLRLQPVFKALPEVIVQSEFLDKSVWESARHVDIINRSRMERQGAQNLADVLGNELNIRLLRDNILGARASVLGTGAENLQVLLDGMPVTGRLNGALDLSQFVLHDVERIEVIKGPVSTLYGSNALGGIVNIIRKKPEYGRLTMGGEGYYESVGQYNVAGQAAVDLHRWRLKAQGGRYFFDGFGADSGIQARYQSWRPKRQAFGGLWSEYSGRRCQVSAEVTFFSEKLQNNGRLLPPFYIHAYDEWIYTHRVHAAVQGRWNFSSRHRLQWTSSCHGFDRRRDTYYKDLMRMEQNLLSQTVDRFGLAMQRTWYGYSALRGTLELLAGWDVRYEWAQGNKLNPSHPSQWDAAGFLTADLKPWTWLHIQGGWRASWNSAFPTVPAPSIALVVKPTDYLLLRLGYARGFRAPDLKELYFEFVDINHNIRGNRELRPETSHHLSWGAEVRRNTKNYGVHATVQAFALQIDQRIVLVGLPAVQDVPLFTYQNVEGFRSVGFSTSLELQWKGLRLEPGYALTWMATRATAPGPYTPFIATPEGRFNFSYHFSRMGITASAFYKYNGIQQVYVALGDTAVTLSHLGAYHQVDVSVMKSFWKDLIKVGFFGKNLLNVTQVIFSQANPGAHQSGAGTTPVLWGRTLGISLSVQWSQNLKKSP